MANAKYDQVSGLVASGSLNWRADEIYALLCKDVTFDAANTRFADVVSGGGSQISSARIEGRYVGTGGEAMGLPVSFPKIAKDTVYQALVVCDLGDSNPQLIAFYDEDDNSVNLTIANNGTFILRPVTVDGATPAHHWNVVAVVNTDELTSGARTILRDYPQYFEVDEGPLNVLTVRLPHPMISGKTVQVYASDDTLNPPQTTLTTAWDLDERNGLLKITDESLLNRRVLVTGFYYNWFADSDLSFHVGQVLDEMNYSSGGAAAAFYQPAQWDLIMLGGVVHALWSLASELSLDIDVSTPEGMFIPARQRYTQIMQMVQYFEGQYNTKAAMLNMGLGSLEQYRLRRVALMTGRYVPVYRDREFDDPRPPERLYPAIPYGAPVTGVEDVVDVVDYPLLPSGPSGPPVVVGGGEDEVAVQPDEPTVPSVVLWVESAPGSSLMSTGGGDEVAVQPDEPTEPGVVIWVDSDE